MTVASEAALNVLTREFQNALQKSVEGIIDAGNVLSRAKGGLKHGQWEKWVIENAEVWRKSAKWQSQPA